MFKCSKKCRCFLGPGWFLGSGFTNDSSHFHSRTLDTAMRPGRAYQHIPYYGCMVYFPFIYLKYQPNEAYASDHPAICSERLGHHIHENPRIWWSFWWSFPLGIHPRKINMGGKKEVLKMIFLLNWVIFRFQPLIFRGVLHSIPSLGCYGNDFFFQDFKRLHHFVMVWFLAICFKQPGSEGCQLGAGVPGHLPEVPRLQKECPATWFQATFK